MSKSKRTSSHSTAIPAVSMIVDDFTNVDDVSKISLGIINQCKPVRGNRRVKLISESGCYLLKVRDISSIQDLRLYSTTLHFDQVIVKRLMNLGFDVKEE